MKVIIEAEVENPTSYTPDNVRNIVERALSDPPNLTNFESLDELIGESVAALGIILGEITVVGVE